MSLHNHSNQINGKLYTKRVISWYNNKKQHQHDEQQWQVIQILISCDTVPLILYSLHLTNLSFLKSLLVIRVQAREGNQPNEKASTTAENQQPCELC